MSIRYNWVSRDSRDDLDMRLAALEGVDILPFVETEGANSWGFVQILGLESVALPVCYADVGLVPVVTLMNELLLLGITELVVGIELSNGDIAFRYKMPTIFHEFVRVDERGILLQDETGFVLLSSHGEELWRFCRDLIQDYGLVGDELIVMTFERERFQVKVGEFRYATS